MTEILIPHSPAWRRSKRIIGPNGRWLSTICPPDKHGKSAGRTYYFCACDPCLAYGKEVSRKARQADSGRANTLVTLGPLRSKVPEGFTENPPPVGDSPAPRHRPGTGGRAHPSGRIPEPPAGATAEDVRVSGPISAEEYIADLRVRMARAGLTA